MPDMPAVAPVVLEAYESLGPWRRADEDVWDLLWLTNAAIGALAEVEDIVRDTDAHTGWGIVLDVDAAPAKMLPWLAQFMGVEVVVGLDDESQRLRIKSVSGSSRGKPGAIVAAAAQFLTGTKRVDLFERDGSAWAFRIRTYAGETPDPQAVKDAVTALKPGGLVFVYEVQEGMVVDELPGTIDGLVGTIDDFSDSVPV